jgi:hypothetical protein
MSGWVLNLGRHTVTGTVHAAGAIRHKPSCSFHRFFSRGRWDIDAVGLVLAGLVLGLVEKQAPIRLIVDETLGRHTGKRIAGASMHRDPLLSTVTRVMFHWGHVWVVLAIEVELFGRCWALPVGSSTETLMSCWESRGDGSTLSAHKTWSLEPEA